MDLLILLAITLSISSIVGLRYVIKECKKLVSILREIEYTAENNDSRLDNLMFDIPEIRKELTDLQENLYYEVMKSKQQFKNKHKND